MTKKFSYLFASIIALNAATLLAQEKPAEGTMTLSKKTFQLKNAVAYESIYADEEKIAVVLSGQPISNERLKKALATEKAGGFAEFPQPYLKLIFNKTGELTDWNALGGGTTVGGSTDGKGELKLDNGRVIGNAVATVDPSALIPKGLDVRFNVALLKSGEELPASVISAKKSGGPAANVKSTVTGTFIGNGKDAKVNYASARWTEPFDNKPGILLLFTEKDHSKNKKPDNDAMFGKYGNALIISLHEDGSIYSCQVVHNAMKNKGFSSSGSIEATPFTYENGKVEGEITTNGAVDAFDEKWEVKLKFVAPLGEIPKEYQVAEEKPAANPSKESDEEDAAMTKANERPAAPGPKAKELALTKDATEIKYAGLVGHIDFRSKLPLKAACSDLTANLKKQGWSKDGDDLITAASSILNRRKGSAKLTIFVKPDPGGSQIKMMTEGLTWDGQ